MKKITLFLLGIFTFLFTIQAQEWEQIAEGINGEAAGDWSGSSVSTNSDGSIVAIGAILNEGNGSNAGHVRVFEIIEGTWTQIGDDIDGEAAEDFSGCSVSLSDDGSILAIGAEGNDGNAVDAGHVRIFENIDGIWTQIGNSINGELDGDQSGKSLCLSADGSTVIIGSPTNDDNGMFSGHIRVFENQSGTWIQIGSTITGDAGFDQLGKSVSISADGSIIAAGAYQNDDNGTNAGHVRIYENNSGVWTQIGTSITGESEGDQSGNAVCLSADGSVVAIGAPYNNEVGNNAGHVRVFENISGVWTQIGTDIDGEAAEDQSGIAVSLSADGAMLAVGAELAAGSGNVRVFENIDGTWTQTGNSINGAANVDYFGHSIALSSNGSYVTVGARGNDAGGTDAGQTKTFGWSVVSTVDVITNNVTNITSNSATGNANITVTGSPNLIQHGVCWNTTGNPSIADNYTEEGSATAGEFSSEIIGLTPNQTYYIKAYVTTDIETIYGNELSFTTLNNVGVESIDQNKISIYPNPTTGIINMELSPEYKKVTITDITGKNIFYINQLDEKQIDISDFKNGIYLIRIQTTKKVFTTKIIKQ